jgi:phenylpropionate dioxygenase-like ring-hydroxylating dioxygenase large terminal subunit
MTTLESVKASPRLHSAPLYDWDELVQEDRVHRLLYTEPAIFDAEMTHIFGGTWVYLAHESQVPNHNDFIAARLGRRPLIITRDDENIIRALYNRCTHRGTTLCRWDKGNSRSFQCPYHGWNFLNTGKLRGVPWAEGYADNLVRDPRYNLAQVPRVESYRGFIFGTLNTDAVPLFEHLGPIRRPIDQWLDRNPGGKVVVCEANRLKYKGNWKLAFDNSGDGYHVVYSHRSLLQTENRFKDEDTVKGMSYYQAAPDDQPMYIQYMGNGHHFKDKRPNLERRPGGLWAIESLHPGMEHVQEKLRSRFGDRAEAILDLAGSEPVNINVFPNLSLLGNHIQVFEPVSFEETDAIWYGTKIEDVDGTLGQDVLTDINTLRMRTQEGFPNFGEVDDVTNFEQIQRGLKAPEDEWIYMNRGLGIPGRIHTLEDGTIRGPATDELFMREYIREWKRLMKAQPNIAIRRDPQP